MYLIDLTGIGETQKYLCDKDTFDWINMKRDCSDSLEYKLREGGYEALDVNPTTGSSPDNDRALIGSAAFETFWSTADLVKYVQENNIEIEGTYEGVIY